MPCHPENLLLSSEKVLIQEPENRIHDRLKDLFNMVLDKHSHQIPQNQSDNYLNFPYSALNSSSATQDNYLIQTYLDSRHCIYHIDIVSREDAIKEETPTDSFQPIKKHSLTIFCIDQSIFNMNYSLVDIGVNQIPPKTSGSKKIVESFDSPQGKNRIESQKLIDLNILLHNNGNLKSTLRLYSNEEFFRPKTSSLEIKNKTESSPGIKAYKYLSSLKMPTTNPTTCSSPLKQQ